MSAAAVPPATLARGAVAGFAGTVATTAFQKLVEMPLTRRPASFVPAKMAARLLPVEPNSHTGWLGLNYAAHFGVGGAWGIPLSLAQRRGPRGQRRIAAVYALLWNTDWIGLVALGIDGPGESR